MDYDIEDFEFAVADRFLGYLHPGESIGIPPTPRAFAAFLADRKGNRHNPVSPTVRAFLRIRAALSEQLSVPRESIRPDTRCDALMPDMALRSEQWRTFRTWLGVSAVPSLVRPPEVTRAIVEASLHGSLVTAFGAMAVSTLSVAFPMALVAAAGIGAVELYRTRGDASLFSPDDLTVGTLAHYAVAYGSPILGDVRMPTTTGQALEVVLALARFEIGGPAVNADATWEEMALSAQPA